MLANLAEVVQRSGKLEEASALLERALAIKIEAHGRKHPLTAYALHGLGVVLTDRHQYAQARTYLQEAFDIFVAAHGSEHPTIAYMLVGLGRCDLALGHNELAVDEAERALAIREKSQQDPVALAEASFLLGQSLAAKHVRKRALEQVRRARELYASAGPGAAREVAEVDAWLRAH